VRLPGTLERLCKSALIRSLSSANLLLRHLTEHQPEKAWEIKTVLGLRELPGDGPRVSCSHLD
jgi:hypothetical protein